LAGKQSSVRNRIRWETVLGEKYCRLRWENRLVWETNLGEKQTFFEGLQTDKKKRWVYKLMKEKKTCSAKWEIWKYEGGGVGNGEEQEGKGADIHQQLLACPLVHCLLYLLTVCLCALVNLLTWFITSRFAYLILLDFQPGLLPYCVCFLRSN